MPENINLNKKEWKGRMCVCVVYEAGGRGREEGEGKRPNIIHFVFGCFLKANHWAN